MKIRINLRSKIIFSVFFVYFFLVFDTSFHGPDEPIYFAYTKSIVEDMDLNIVDNVDYSLHPFYLVSGKKEVSATYNLPDFHAHGGVILWAPFYIYAKAIYGFANKFSLKSIIGYGLDRLTACAMSFSTIIFAFLTLILTFFLCREFFSTKISILSILMIFFGTPFFYFALYESGNAQILASLFSVISICVLVYAARINKLEWFFYGVFSSICATVKYDLWFQAFSIVFIFTYLALSKQIDWKKGLYFIAGFLPAVILKIANDYIKYGSFHQGEFGLLNFNSFYFFEQLFSSYHGFVYTSPIFYICFAGFVLLAVYLFKNRTNIQEISKKDFLIFIISISLFIKIFFMSFRYAWGGGTPGARLLLSDYTIFVLLYACALRNQKKNIQYLLFFLSLLFISWNFIVISEFMTQVDIQNIGKAVSLTTRFDSLKYLYQPLFLIKDFELKLVLLFPLLTILGVVFYIFSHLKKQKKIYLHKAFIYLTIYCFLSYAVVTVINLYNNQLNSKKLKKTGFFQNARVIGPLEYERLENNNSIDEMIRYYQLIGNNKKVLKLKNISSSFQQ